MITISPATFEECSSALASSHRITFVGGGTELDLGNPVDADAIVRTDRLKKIIDYSPSDMVLTAEAGTTLEEINDAAREHRQMLALDAPQPGRATAGGLVATGAYGPRRAKYGAVRDLIIGVTIVRADGVIARGGGKVVKNVAGFDLPRMACGSFGTLGMIAGATFRLHPLPEMIVTALFENLSPDQVFALVKSVRQAQLEPSSAVAIRSGGAYDLGFRFEGFGKGVTQQVERVLKLGNGSQLDAGDERAFWRRHDDARSGGPTRIRIASLPATFPKIAGIVDRLQPASFAWYATLGLGFARGEMFDASAIGAAREAIAATGGSLIVETAPPSVREHIDVWGPRPASFRIMEELKLRFDPERRLNPGRFVGGL